MNYTTSEIGDLALGQLTTNELQEARRAFDGFARLFGRSWIDKVFEQKRSPVLVLYIRSLWEKWLLVGGLDKSEEMIKRWRSGIEELGVTSELEVIAPLADTCSAVELFPQVGSKVPDLRFQADSPWIYCEVSGRGLSKVWKRGTDILNRVASAAANMAEGTHGMVAILRDLRECDIQRLISWLYSARESDEAKLDDLGVFRAGEMGSSMDQDQSLVSLVPAPRAFATSFTATDGHIHRKGTACMSISDRSAHEILETEASQLPRDHPGLIFLDISKVIGGITEWVPLIQRRFQPNINTRISGVILFRVSRTLEGPILQGRMLLNQYARNPLPEAVVTLLRGMFTRSPSEQAAQHRVGRPVFETRFISTTGNGEPKEGVCTLYNGKPTNR